MQNENLNSLSERLNYAMQQAGMSQGALAKSAGLAQPTIWRIASGRALGSSKILDIAKALGVEAEWLINGNGSMYPDDISKEKIKLNFLDPDDREMGKDPWDEDSPFVEGDVEVPYLRDIRFTRGDGKINDGYSGQNIRFRKSDLRLAGANADGSGVVCFPAKGNGMDPFITDGSKVAINTFDKNIIDGKTYVVSEDGWKRIKVLYRTGPDSISLRSYNDKQHPPEDKPLSRIEIIGRVIWYSVII